jgi:hypothetical protein
MWLSVVVLETTIIQERKPPMPTTQTMNYLDRGTRVLNMTDGEPGTVLNGFAFDPARGWYEYEVETQYGVECWPVAAMLTFDQMEQD